MTRPLPGFGNTERRHLRRGVVQINEYFVAYPEMVLGTTRSGAASTVQGSATPAAPGPAPHPSRPC